LAVQFGSILHPARIVLREISTFEFTLGAKQPGANQICNIIQVCDVVLNGCCRGEESILIFDVIHEIVAVGVLVTEIVCFVDD
jgi:hypothetical protein